MPFQAARVVICGLLGVPTFVWGQASHFVGAFGGISTLSADGRSVSAATAVDASLYKPENGPAFQVFGGHHLSDYLSLQGGYGWNRNDVTLTSSLTSGTQPTFYDQMRRVTQHSVIGELLLYFRRRSSSARPYLSAGTGVVHLTSGDDRVRTVGDSSRAPGAFQSTKPALRIAVGIDLFFGNGWAFRYAFSETIRSNAISSQLTPPAQRNLANFQNLFGMVKHF